MVGKQETSDMEGSVHVNTILINDLSSYSAPIFILPKTALVEVDRCRSYMWGIHLHHTNFVDPIFM